MAWRLPKESKAARAKSPAEEGVERAVTNLQVPAWLGLWTATPIISVTPARERGS